MCSLAEKEGTPTAWMEETEELVILRGLSKEVVKGKGTSKKNSQGVGLEEGT